MKRKQLELFSVDDMYGCVGVKDELYAVAVAVYLWAMRQVSELDDETFRKVKKECEDVKIGGENKAIKAFRKYHIKEFKRTNGGLRALCKHRI